MSDDTISRQAAIDALDEYIEEYSFDLDENGYHNPKWCAMQEARMTIQRLPSAERRGRWIMKKDVTFPHMVCSECKKSFYGNIDEVWSYCPNCGARMEVE